MNRLLVLTLAASIANAPVAFAGESLLKSGTRHVQEIAASSTAAPAVESAKTAAASTATIGKKPASAFQTQGATLSKSGMSRGMKALIFIGLGVGVAASMYAIDHHVLDVTPSSLGTRQD
jgi:hypothetical protein